MPQRGRRPVVRVGDDLAVLLTADEARALNATEGGEIESCIVPGAVELLCPGAIESRCPPITITCDGYVVPGIVMITDFCG